MKKIPNINARDFATILNLNPYQSPFQLLESKVEKRHPFYGNKFTEHGNKYENLALQKYSQLTGNIVNSKQKNIKHPDFSWITGRMDGIVNISQNDTDSINNNDIDETNEIIHEIVNDIVDNVESSESLHCKKRKRPSTKFKPNKKRKVSSPEININDKHIVVEVKCPLNKQIKDLENINDVPKHYWSQVQVYMNMMNSDIAHYVEFHIQPDAPEDTGIIKFVPLEKDEVWWNENLPKIVSFYDEVKKYCELGSLDSHPVRIAEKQWIDSL